MRLGRGSAAALVLAAAACSGPPRPYAFDPGRADLHVVVTESLAGPAEERPLASRRIEIWATGRRDGGALSLRLERLAYEASGGARPERVRLSTEDVAVGAAGSADDRNVLGVLESLRGRELSLRFEPARGLVAVEGLDAGLAAAPVELADARDGLLGLLSDASMLDRLRAAGLGPVSSAILDPTAEVEREAQFEVPGRGRAAAELRGMPAAEPDGSPVLVLEGRLAADAVFRGEPGEGPPPEVGEIRVAQVEARASTLYGRADLVPLSGWFELNLPYALGVATRTRTGFTLVLP